jgi:tetratricopeptide (TPR) repeat protein
MKVFLSYGHEPPENKALVERIGAALNAAGFETWIDTANIEHNDPWRRSIMQGLQTSDWTLAFLSRHAMRDPGVCLDELAIATHVKGGAIATVLIEPLADARPPQIVSHLQWIDMSDWRAREQAGGPEWDAWFQARLDDIKRVLTSPAAQRFAAEIDQLDRLLHPVEQAADIPPLLDGFVGREWLLAEVNARRSGALASRLIWLTGGPGAGKSAFAAWLATYQRANIIALNLCDARLDARNQPTRVLRTLAFQLARAIPDYRGHLLDRLARLAHRKGDDPLAELAALSAAEFAQLQAALGDMPPEELFQWLLAEPLFHCIDGGRMHDRYLVVLDGLDETLREHESPLAELIADRAPRLPEWLAILATSRPDTAIARIFSHVEPFRLDEAPGNQDDLRVYAQGWLGTADPGLLDRVVAAAGGKFIYLRMLHQAVEAKWMRLDGPEGLPRGMAGMYRRWFRRQFPDQAAYEHEWLPLLSVLAAARLAVPLHLLAAMPRFNWSVRAQALVLQRLGSLFEARGGALSPCHASLRDWLLDPDAAGPTFVVDVATGRRMLADALWPRLVALLGTPAGTLPDAFTLAELPAQMLPQGPDALRAHIATAGGWEQLFAQLADMITILQRKFDWPGALDWLALLDKLSEATGNAALSARRWASVELGDILLTTGQTGTALLAFRNSRDFASRLAAADPGNAAWQRDLSVSHERLGDVLSAQGDLPGALADYRAGMAIRARLAAADPGNAAWQRDLSVSHERLGDVLRAQGDLPGALADYRAGMAIRARLAAANPGNAEWQRDVIVSCVKLAEADPRQARVPLTQALAIAHDLAASGRLAPVDAWMPAELERRLAEAPP